MVRDETLSDRKDMRLAVLSLGGKKYYVCPSTAAGVYLWHKRNLYQQSIWFHYWMGGVPGVVGDRGGLIVTTNGKA